MAITDLTELVEAHPGIRSVFQRAGVNCNQGEFGSMWKTAGTPAPGVNPPTGAGEVPTRATTGAIGPPANAGGADKLYLAEYTAIATQTALGALLYDRLVHTSGLVGNLNTLQTVNSVSVNRPDSSGEGVLLTLECYTAIGATAATVTCSYTNQAGTAGRTSEAVTANGMQATDMLLIPLQAGDTGVRSVESVTLSASTGTAGNFGVTLMYPYLWGQERGIGGTSRMFHDWLDVGLPEIADDACLALALTDSGSTSDITGLLRFIQG